MDHPATPSLPRPAAGAVAKAAAPEAFGLEELLALAGERLGEEISPRTVRLYATQGLIDRPGREGRSATYGRRHLLQLLLIRSLARRGLSLAAIAPLIGLGDDELERQLAQLGTEGPGSLESPDAMAAGAGGLALPMALAAAGLPGRSAPGASAAPPSAPPAAAFTGAAAAPLEPLGEGPAAAASPVAAAPTEPFGEARLPAASASAAAPAEPLGEGPAASAAASATNQERAQALDYLRSLQSSASAAVSTAAGDSDSLERSASLLPLLGSPLSSRLSSGSPSRSPSRSPTRSGGSREASSRWHRFTLAPGVELQISDAVSVPPPGSRRIAWLNRLVARLIEQLEDGPP